MKKQLEKYLTENEEIYLALNSIAINITHASRKENFIDCICNYLEEELAEELLDNLVNDNLLKNSIQYECDEEFNSAILLQETCEYCENKIEDHEYYLLYEVEFLEVLREYNLELLKRYFSSDSQVVICDLRENMHKVIPFVGAGISKSLGFPLWKDLFLFAREGIPDEYIAVFDKRYRDGNIDKLIECILEFHPLIQNEKDLKSKIIKPQVNKKLTALDINCSILPDLLNLDTEYILTTNYDHALEQCNQQIEAGYDISRNVINFEGFENLEDQKYVFHLHGDVDMLDSMIVTNKDYIELYSKEDNKRILTGLISKYSMLFLGFSMNDQYFSQELKSISDSNRGYGTNYMVLINSNASIEKNILDSNNVKFINLIAKMNDDETYEVDKQYKFLFNFINGNILD
ncbi:SIR2 family protein [Enterococcus faecalis]|uniref:SIR2 family protein n=1 Tax=Enterococcus TaxID=1350 RepID=UPI00100EB982|nr:MULTISPECIES: SIR2 family protein [Enterococcus]EGO2608314.1 SIR2 family protein [Enterococcus faecalis]EGO7756698.1 SIR2 family protein [Enterococcus faecalis]EGO7934926.1 SIR2 family protein [Enterococcus faecalis]EGO8057461.1 SIR2 family protein [Enterococcus faecalis]EGO8106155.1 SIR2 family protein [Enterococcus faecalis]